MRRPIAIVTAWRDRLQWLAFPLRVPSIALIRPQPCFAFR
jgi:hypothetical protein